MWNSVEELQKAFFRIVNNSGIYIYCVQKNEKGDGFTIYLDKDKKGPVIKISDEHVNTEEKLKEFIIDNLNPKKEIKKDKK